MASPPSNKLQTIADLAGVSRMTVSRALRNQPNVRQEVRERIYKIATEIGYRPNPLISTLMADLKRRRVKRVAEVIAFLTADPEGREQWRRSETVALFHAGAVERAAQLGYRLEHFWAKEPGMTPGRLSRVLWSRGISGVLLAPSWMSYQHDYPEFDWSHFAAACLGYTMSQPDLHRACNNQYLTMRSALRHLRESGYRRIGLALSRSDDNRVLNHWQAAYLADQAMHDAPEARVPVFLSDEVLELPSNRRPFQDWVRRHAPDGVVSVHHGFLRDWMEEAGLRVPEDIGYADLDLSGDMFGRVAGMDQNSRFVGAAAIDLIVGQHHRNERGIPAMPTITSVNGSWCDGETVRGR
ncbi:transcriptional regulator [Opitutaceae bacterium TAV1]|nr:LacI family transcriptional regulator [Opitutaceae bacterium TAV5]EIP98020.1 transcriptional regulator [Opitutaceae bacterium TAV1]